MNTPTVAFAGSPLDRADHIRADPDALAGLMNWRARLLKLDGLMPVISDVGELCWGTLADAAGDAELVFLGLIDGKGCFAAVPDQGATGPAYANPAIWQAMQTLALPDLATYGVARSLVDWHARHQFCARCGANTKLTKGGWQRNCDTCEAQHFPRTDPVTIMLVEHEGRLLLGRQPRFPVRMFSALAGFVEPGETIEEAVAREVHEEAGIRVRDVTYLATQPWPFPSQLMIGCHSFCDDPDITIDETELEDARWFTRAELEEARAAGEAGTETLIFPRSFAIAYNLMTWWLDKD
jgi:NAD+ diphosphatase